MRKKCWRGKFLPKFLAPRKKKLASVLSRKNVGDASDRLRAFSGSLGPGGSRSGAARRDENRGENLGAPARPPGQKLGRSGGSIKDNPPHTQTPVRCCGWGGCLLSSYNYIWENSVSSIKFSRVRPDPKKYFSKKKMNTRGPLATRVFPMFAP